MTNENMKSLIRAYATNISVAQDNLPQGRGFMPIAQIATIIDFLNGDIEGLEPPTMSTSMANGKTPVRGGDPQPLTTECLKRLGELGLQSLFDVKGYKFDSEGNLLLHINGRFANTGWTNGDKRVSALMSIMDEVGITLQRID